MLAEFFKKEEKKVEYIELIYDLIFVYIIGRNNSLLHSVEGGFFPVTTYLTYILSTLIILQIWYFSTLFINRYGTGGISEYIGIFINMYLLYYMADSTRADWHDYYLKYSIAWALILLNLAVQYFIKLRQSDGLMPWQSAHIKFNIALMLSQAGIIAASVPAYLLTGLPLAPFAMVFGIFFVLFLGRTNKLMTVDFPHLTERVMLYVVFTFGEMIIGISGYFKGSLNPRTIYFSVMGFAIVVGLFTIYGYFYDHIIDRELKTTATGYMLLHIFLITALNNITIALEFMQEEHIDIVLKNIFLTASFLIYFIFLFATEKYAKGCCKPSKGLIASIAGISAAFAGAMALSYNHPDISIAATVAYIYIMLIIYYKFNSKREKQAAL